MEVLDVHNSKNLERAAEAVRAGELVVYPTDTAYGLGASMLHPQALKNLYALKRMSAKKPTHVMVADMNMAAQYVKITEIAEKLSGAFLPGPLTLVLTALGNVPAEILGGGDSLGVRIPDYMPAQEFARLAGAPITTTSANIHRGATPYSIDTVKRSFGGDISRIAVMLDGGVLPGALPSTLVDCRGIKPIVLREGPITREEVSGVVG